MTRLACGAFFVYKKKLAHGAILQKKILVNHLISNNLLCILPKKIVQKKPIFTNLKKDSST